MTLRRHSASSVETELKYSLSKEEYLKLKKYLKIFFIHKKQQTNFYFDTPQLNLKKNKIGLRIRIEDSHQATLTMKLPAKKIKSSMAGLKVRIEIETPVKMTTATTLIKNKKNISSLKNKAIKKLSQTVTKPDLDALICLGSLKNERIVFQHPEIGILELDRSHFFGTTFYELEIETDKPRKIHPQITHLFRELKIVYCPGQQSKLERFLREWKLQAKKKA